MCIGIHDGTHKVHSGYPKSISLAFRAGDRSTSQGVCGYYIKHKRSRQSFERVDLMVGSLVAQVVSSSAPLDPSRPPPDLFAEPPLVVMRDSWGPSIAIQPSTLPISARCRSCAEFQQATRPT